MPPVPYRYAFWDKKGIFKPCVLQVKQNLVKHVLKYAAGGASNIFRLTFANSKISASNLLVCNTRKHILMQNKLTGSFLNPALKQKE